MTAEYRLLTYREGAKATAGVLVDDRVYPAASLLPSNLESASVLGLLQAWDEVHPRLCRAAEAVRAGDGLPLAKLVLAAPILYPAAVFATGGNYTDHLEEMARVAGRTLTKYRVAEPFFTLKTAAHSIIGHQAPIRYPRFSQQLDYEAEIGVVIGRETDNIPESRAMDAVAGYAIINDLSAREMSRREALPNQMIHDWFGQKCFRDSMPMGPWLTPAAFVPDPQNMQMRLWVNGVLKQDGNSKNMVYPIAEQISYLSRHLTLRPGDVLSTGCPAGVGAARGEFLKPGDELRLELSHCGELLNTVVAGD
jgi:2-keto-4-pentenoate hydratase/2-oxohepta-3-ene-1,7-dioic acid hydratase in catechol pathway